MSTTTSPVTTAPATPALRPAASLLVTGVVTGPLGIALLVLGVLLELRVDPALPTDDSAPLMLFAGAVLLTVSAFTAGIGLFRLVTAVERHLGVGAAGDA